MGDSLFRLALMTGPGVVKLESRNIPPIQSNEILIRVAFCGICGTDLAIYNGSRTKIFPYLPGHEYTGVIEIVGTNVCNFAVGDRITVNPNFVCGTCYFCKCGQQNLCIEADIRLSSNGGMAEYVAIRSDMVHLLPDTVSNLVGTLVEPMACILHMFDQITPQSRRLAVIMGAGTVGLLALEMLREYSTAQEILVSDPVAYKRQIAKMLGATIVVDPNEESVQQIAKRVSPVGADLIIECSGNLCAVQSSLGILRAGGEIMLVGRPHENDTLTISPFTLARREVTIKGSSRFSSVHLEKAIDRIASGKISSHYYVQDVYQLSSIEHAFAYAMTGQSIKTVLACT